MTPIYIGGRISMKIAPVSTRTRTMTNLDSYLKSVDRIVSRNDAQYLRIYKGSNPGQISTCRYEKWPQTGYTTIFSAGLSLFNNPAWKLSRPEIVLTVMSEDPQWASVLGQTITESLGKTNYEYGAMIKVPVAMPVGCLMDSICIYRCSVLDVGQEAINLPDYKVVLSQMYPIYKNEMGLISKDIQKFFADEDMDWYDPMRSPKQSL